MNHKLHKCNDPNCRTCEGGLAWCEVCGGGEASLPTECPGSRMDMNQATLVQAGEIDFIKGAWERLPRPSATK